MKTEPSGQCVVILPYYCESEVARYLRTAEWLQSTHAPLENCRFLLAASPKAQLNSTLQRAFEQLGPTHHFQCPTQVFGYPQGPTAMFWDCMDYCAENFSGPGFSLWLESDMAFTKPDWVDRLRAEWFSKGTEPLLMGCYVPEVYKFRWLRARKKILDPHINGGACYRLDFARHMPASAREGVFDMVVYREALARGPVIRTRQIDFSTLSRVRRDRLNPEVCILHGFMQDKDQFVEACVSPLAPREQQWNWRHQLAEEWDWLQRKVSVCVYRRGREAVLQNVLLTRHQWQRRQAG